MTTFARRDSPGGKPSGLTMFLESSTAHGSVALFDGDSLLASVDAPLQARDAERLMPAVAAAFSQAGVNSGDLARVACSDGPGSFTGIRIGAAIAKGFAQALDIPLHAVSSLLLVGAEAAERFGDGRYLASMDAMRGERHVLEVVAEGGMVCEAGELQLVDEKSLSKLSERLQARLVGPEAGDIRPHARSFFRCCDAPGPALDLSGWEPAYGRVAEAQAKWERAHGRPLAGA